MNKKGFTLVELLAVVAILAILVIIALPNVLKMYNNAKKSAFLTEAKTVYKEAANKYITESMKGNKVSYINSNSKNSLELSSAKDISYCINLDKSGKVTSLIVSNNNYLVEYDGTTDITNFNNTNVKDNDGNVKLICSKNGSKVIKKPKSKECSGSDNKTYTDSLYTYTNTNRGWIVKLTNLESTDPIDTAPCSSIDGKAVTSMKGLFYNSKASSIDVSKFYTSDVTDMSGMFNNAAATEIKGLEYLDTSDVTDMGSMFSDTFKNNSDDNSQKAILDLSGFNTSKVKYMASMFSGTKANNIDVSNFDTSSVINMHRTFYYTTNVQTLDLSSFDTSKVQLMSAMFMGSGVTNIIGLNKLNTSSLTDMNSMFRLNKMNVLDISSFDTSNVKNMGALFANTNNTTEIKFGNKFNTSKVTNMAMMFELCGATELPLNKFDTSNVTDMSRMFYSSKALKLDLSSFDTSNVSKMDWMFRNNYATEIIFSDKFTTSKVTNMDSMFSNSKAAVLDLSSFDTSNVTSINQTFKDCSAKVGYAKTQQDADKLNNSTGKPSGLTFVVK